MVRRKECRDLLLRTPARLQVLIFVPFKDPSEVVKDSGLQREKCCLRNHNRYSQRTLPGSGQLQRPRNISYTGKDKFTELQLRAYRLHSFIPLSLAKTQNEQ